MSRVLGKEVLVEAQASRNNTTYSGSMKFDTCTGDVALRVIATGANSYAITQQCSTDDHNWYDCTDGNEGAFGAVASTTTTAVSAWVVPTLAPAPYTRFKIVESADAAAGLVTIEAFFSEDI